MRRLWKTKAMTVEYAIAWSGIMMLFNFCMWSDNILAWYHDLLSESKWRIVNIFGLCTVCTGFWWGILFWSALVRQDYVIFVGVSQGILVIYSIVMEKLFG